MNYFKDLYTKDKRFQAFVKVLMGNMSIPVIVQGVTYPQIYGASVLG